MFWVKTERLKRDFTTGDSMKVLFTISKRTFKGNVKQQLMMIEAETKNDITNTE